MFGWLAFIVLVSTDEQEWAKDGNNKVTYAKEVTNDYLKESVSFTLPSKGDKKQGEIKS